MYLEYIYLILLCVLLPLYMKSGYYQLGEAKAQLYLIISLCALIAFLIRAALRLKDKKSHSASELSVEELFIRALLFSNIITFIFSINKKTSLLGLEGWRSGLLITALMLFFCHVFMREINISSYIAAASLFTPFLMFVLGIINRFGANPLNISSFGNPAFIATIGNINWYAGFLSVFLPVGFGLGFTRKLFSKAFYMCAAYTAAGVCALFLQGSESAILIIIASFLMLLFVGLTSRESFKNFLAQIFVLGIGMELATVLLIFFKESYSYDGNALTAICLSHTGLVLMAFSVFAYRLGRLFEEISLPWNRRLYCRLAVAVIAAGVACAGIYAFDSGLFETGFGNGRLIIWDISSEIFLSLSPWQKLFGIGQDCFSEYAYGNSEWAYSLFNVFGNNILTNAHSELLTTLIERGLVGVVCHYGFIICIIFSFLKYYVGSSSTSADNNANIQAEAQKRKRTALICALPVISYSVFSLLSFSQITATPYMFICAGLCCSNTAFVVQPMVGTGMDSSSS